MQVLIIEPDAGLRRWIAGELRKQGHRVESRGGLFGPQKAGTHELIVVGNKDQKRIEAWCRQIRTRAENPSAFVLGLIPAKDIQKEKSLLEAGADDAVWRAEERERLALRLECAARQAARRSLYDPLTRLPNRMLFLEMLKRAIVAAQRRGAAGFAVLFLDLDGFKRINDRYGHAAGDRVLVQVAQRLRKALRRGDVLARYGGDEFAVLLSGGTVPALRGSAVIVSKTGHGPPKAADSAAPGRELTGSGPACRPAERVTARLRAAVARPLRVAGQNERVTASIGAVTSEKKYAQAKRYLEAADREMYRGKAVSRSACR